MKIAWKIFCMAYFVVLLTVGIGGFALIEFASSSVIESRIEGVLSSNLYSAKIFLALSEQNAASLRNDEISYQVSKMTDTDASSDLTICELSETALYDSSAFANNLSDSEQGYAFIELDGNKMMQAICRTDVSDEHYYVETLSDFSQVFSQRDSLIMYYRYTLIATALLSGIILLIFSIYIANPIKKLTAAVNLIAVGDYKRRIPLRKRGMGSEEVYRLSIDFNSMANAVETKITELKDEIEKREIFVADFTHELKTPMTSIIGYADMLRSYELDKDEQREIADTVYKEAKRLEKLSMELLNIIVLKNNKITLQSINAELLFDNLKKSLLFLSEKYNIKMNISCDPAFVKAEPSLMLSLIYNLADNACKASQNGDTVTITGENKNGRYIISVCDNGSGISEENLNKITEAFFMEDKSRSRKQGGAGLGLALCKLIAELHNTKLEFYSKMNVGTTVLFELDTDNNRNTKECVQDE